MAMPMARPTMAASAIGELNTRLEPYLRCKPGRGLEDAALPFHVRQVFDAAAVGDVFSEDYDALVAGHFVEQRGRDDFDHRFGMAVQMRLRFKLLRGGIDIGRVDIHVNRIGRRRFGRERAIGGLGNFADDVGFESFEFVLVEDALAHEEHREFRHRIAVRLGFALLGSLVELFVVGKRMRIGPRNMRMHQRRSGTRAAMCHGAS